MLIVEDDQPTRAALLRLAQSSGFDAVACGSPDRALDLIDEQCPHAVVVDWELGAELDGVDVVRAAMAQSSRPAIAMITGADLGVLREQTRDVPVDAYLAKPFSRAEFAALLDLLRAATEDESH